MQNNKCKALSFILYLDIISYVDYYIGMQLFCFGKDKDI
jgi:hypothetical protein